MKTLDAARGKWFGILSHFGVEQSYLRNVHGPCPLCGGKDRFRWHDREGRGEYFCNGCGPGDGMDLVQKLTGMDFKESAKAIDEIIGNIEIKPVKQQRDPRIRLRKIAQGLGSMEGINPVRRYLKSRGLKPSPSTEYHPSLAYYEDGRRVGNFPAMVHLFRAADFAPASYHITYLTPAGEKAQVSSPRKVMPSAEPMAGGAIHLATYTDVLGVAEGIETALAATQKTGVPCWACYSAGLLEQFVPPKAVKRVVIFGDNDTSFTGQASAYSLAKRLVRDGVGVEVRIPESQDSDWADQA